ncbi:LuxR C-terminal-related transcriptional regulator [Marinobacter sp. CHS3-4]|uniref:LuxR C-terminal-related transcriptional regulator n=1 Tax=Marinobacter sp. CHS3-4 TaxID=3045174 RepID=UPI0024B4A349|nr:LuxR C-terminal-related transcriptional regulator [Marinobacter sp. CHS3-4]MDI9244950.1 LuxR C-terminal-related transcriptional regulator [Marinobacter sp. CHS3-4]
MKPFDDGCAANDEFQSALGGSYQGELVRDLLRQRVRMPEPVEHYLARPKLTENITAATGPGSVLFLEAPPGYGKSHALCAAFRETGLTDRLSWLTLTGLENDAGRLLALLEVAVAARSKFGGRSSKNAASYPDALSMLLSAFESADFSGARTLVIDNVGIIAHPASIGLLQQLVLETPANLSVVLVSRKPLPFETHSLELAGRFRRIGPDELELSRAETFDFLKGSLERQAMTTITAEHLYALTEGWVTPLGLYQQEIKADPDARLPIQESASVERFLRDAVLIHLTPGQQRSLRIMAELDVVSDDLFLALADSSCDHAFRPSAAAEAGIPIRQVPGRGKWFRFKPLVHDWLKTPAVDGTEDRALKASRWFSRRNQVPEALRYALIAGAHDEAVRIASDASEALLIGQDTASLLSLRHSLPESLFVESPRLKIVYGWVHAIGGQFVQARKLVSDLEADTDEFWRCRIDALRGFVLRGEGAVDEALECANRALESDKLSAQGRLVTELVRSSAFCAQGNFSKAREANRNAVRLAREAGDAGSEALAVYAHARIELGKGALKHAEQLLRTGLDMAMNDSARAARVGEVRLQLHLVMVLWHQGRESEADRLLVTCIRHAEQTRDLALLLALSIRVLICRTNGRLDEAFTWIGRAERAMQAWKVDAAVYVPVLEALKISTWLVSGQLDASSQALERLAPWREENCVPDMFPMMPGLLDCLQARLEIARNEDDKAAGTLKAIRDRHQEMVPFGLELHVRLLESVIASRKNGLAQAQKLLLDAVNLASEAHYISPFSELRRELAPLIEKTWPRLPDSDFTKELGRRYGIAGASGAEPIALAEPISERERGVLELIAQGFSNQDIADNLHISLHTVKTHARRINAKLEVKSRTQAIVRARELGLL